MAFKLGYRPEFDGIRAVAVGAVMLCHSSLLAKGSDLMGAGAAFPSLMRGGMYGVDIFFVLSGFLITTLMLSEHEASGKIDFRAFYVRRVLRLFPAMALLLFGSLVYVLFFETSGSRFDLLAIGISALYISNFALIFAGLRLGMLTPTWSLSVEEQFYSLWPITLTFLLRLERRHIFKIVLAGAFGAAVLRAILFAESRRLYSWPLFGSANHFLLARADGLMLGALVAMAASWGWLPDARSHEKRWKIAAWASALGLAALLAFGPNDYGPSVFYFVYSATGVLTALLLAALLMAPPAALLAILKWPPLVWMGKISYGLYLFHMPVYALMPSSGPSFLSPAAGSYFLFAVAVAISFCVAGASYYAIERRCLDLRHLIGRPRGLVAQAEF